jgi:hypothetical protein
VQDTPAQDALEAGLSEDQINAFADQLAADLFASDEEDLDEAVEAVEAAEAVKDTRSESSKPAEVDAHEPEKVEATEGVVLQEDTFEGFDLFGDALQGDDVADKATAAAQGSSAAFILSLPAPPPTGRLVQKASAPSLTGRLGSQPFRLWLPGDQDPEVMYVLARIVRSHNRR